MRSLSKFWYPYDELRSFLILEFMGKFIKGFVLGMALLGLASCAASASSDAESVRVGMECAYVPYNWEEGSASKDNAPIENHSGFYADGYDVQIAKKLGEGMGKEVVFVKISWDGLMTPYPSAPVYKGDHYFGRGEEHLRYLKEEVLPIVTKSLANPPSFYGIAGYSLAGLFACSTLFWDTPFSRVASASGSLWYPGFLEFAKQYEGSLSSKVVSLSLGNKESLAKNAIVAQVGEKTEQFLALIKEKGAEASFEWNEGNHFVDADARMARAIAKLL